MKIKMLKILLFIILCYAYTAYAASFFQTTIPLEFNTGNPSPYGLPSTIINIQGKKIPIIFDTGAKKSSIVLTKYALKGIHVKFTGEKECSQSMNGKHCEDVCIIPKVKIGDFVIKNVKGSLMTTLWGGNDSHFKNTEASKNGILGYAFLSKFNILLDYPESKVVLTKRNQNPTHYDIRDWISIPFVGHLQTRLIINNKFIALGWDTGAVPSVVKKNIFTHFPIISCPDDAPYSKNNCVSIKTISFKTEAG